VTTVPSPSQTIQPIAVSANLRFRVGSPTTAACQTMDPSSAAAVRHRKCAVLFGRIMVSRMNTNYHAVDGDLN